MANELDVGTLTTPELVKRWADATSANNKAIALALQNIQELASFIPRSTSPLYTWWIERAQPQR